MRVSGREALVASYLLGLLLLGVACRPSPASRPSRDPAAQTTAKAELEAEITGDAEVEHGASARATGAAAEESMLAIQPLAALPPAAGSSANESVESVASESSVPAESAVLAESDVLAESALPTESVEQSPQSRPAQRIVKVFYGTDRLLLHSAGSLWRFPAWWLAAGCVFTATAVLGLALLPKVRLGASIAAGIGLLATGSLAILQSQQARDGNFHLRPGSVEYGNERGELRFGECEVSIPNSHKSGEIERPSIWRLELAEREDRHVVLQRVVARDSASFFKSLREQVKESPRRDLFVFIHGYNVSFSMAARRTAQMKHDLGFEGAAMFYSWPSQGGLLRYTVDENNAHWTAPHLKQFLRDVAQRSDAESIYVIAHSMGSRALAGSLCELADDLAERPDLRGRTLFTEVILAAPDIDADVFERDVAPAILKTAKNATLYASANDQALRASKVVHGYARAGDAGEDLVIVPGIDTIDVSSADLSLLGHSYYAESGPIESDLEMLLSGRRSTHQRGWLEPEEHQGRRFWVLDPTISLAQRRGQRWSSIPVLRR